jgi:hypothetical protein
LKEISKERERNNKDRPTDTIKEKGRDGEIKREINKTGKEIY